MKCQTWLTYFWRIDNYNITSCERKKWKLWFFLMVCFFYFVGVVHLHNKGNGDYECAANGKEISNLKAHLVFLLRLFFFIFFFIHLLLSPIERSKLTETNYGFMKNISVWYIFFSTLCMTRVLFGVGKSLIG